MSTECLPVAVTDLLDGLFGQYTVAGQARGLVYGLVGPGGLVHSAGFGAADDAGTPPGPDTVFPIASMTKSVVACAALLARDRGLLDIDAPINQYLDEYPTGRAAASPVELLDDEVPSVRMLLCMSGGLTEDNAWVDPFIGRPTGDLLEQVRAGLAYSNPPGIAYEYSNLGYALAGIAIGRAVRRPLERWIRDELLTPLGMQRTWFDHAAPAEPGACATGYTLDPQGAWVAYPPARSDAFAAAGGLQSTVRDIATWITWLGAAFRPDEPGAGRGPVRRSSRREMQRIQQICLPAMTSRPDGGWAVEVEGYGLGLRVLEDLQRGTIVAHSGGLPGFLLNMIWHPDSGHGIVVLTNSHRGDPVALSERALHLVLDRERTPARTVRIWPDTAELARRAEGLVRSWDDRLAAEIFAENVAVDRPLDERRTDIAALIDQIGPLVDGPTGARQSPDIVSAVSAAEVAWSVPGERGELICRIHLTPVRPARIQEFEVVACPYGTPRAAQPIPFTTRRRSGGLAIGSLPRTRVRWPAMTGKRGGHVPGDHEETEGRRP